MNRDVFCGALIPLTCDRPTFDYFDLDDEGVITVAPRGYARDYKPGRVVDIAAEADRYAVPDPAAARIGGSW